MARVLVLALFALALLSGTAEALKLFGHQYNVPHLGHRSSEESCARGEPCDVTSQQAARDSNAPAAVGEEGGHGLWPLSAFDWATPFAPLAQLRAFAPLMRQMDELMASRAGAPAMAVARTAVDVRETPDAFEFVADVPGLARDDVKVVVSEDNVLTISGERRLLVDEGAAEKEKEGTAASTEAKAKEGAEAGAPAPYHHRIERSFGRFVRSFKLPRNADADKVSASVVSGVLTVRVPKKEVPPEPTRGLISVDWKEL